MNLDVNHNVDLKKERTLNIFLMFFFPTTFLYKVGLKAKFLNKTIKNLELPFKIKYGFRENFTRYLTIQVTDKSDLLNYTVFYSSSQLQNKQGNYFTETIAASDV